MGAVKPTPDLGERIFAKAVAFVIDFLEGGEQLIQDSGGLTRWGISKKAYPALDILSLTRSQAEDVYRRDYWNRIKADLLPPALALLVFSCAVNMGVKHAAMLLQRVLRVDVDGAIGQHTLIAAQGFKPQMELRVRFCELWLRSYYDLARSKPVYVEYLYGWSCRVLRTLDEAARWA